jgi:iron complex outermembrane receptor protein
MDTTAIDNSNRNVKRNFKALFMEDIWDITDDLRLSAGMRWDDYSDFGSEISPRAGLTWEFFKDYDLKLLYGHAFRAPSFMELYNLGMGNPDLDPETIDTYQVSLGAEFSTALNARLTWYRNDENNGISIMIEPGSDFLHYKNFGRMRSEGLELEMRYDFGRGTYLAMNYTYQLYKKRVMWPVPRIQGNIMLNMRLSRHLNLYGACHFEDGFRRSEGDARDDMSGYGIINTTLIYKPLLKGYEGLELRGSVYNLFDKDYTSPTGAGELPEDTPRPGRSFLFEIKYKF